MKKIFLKLLYLILLTIVLIFAYFKIEKSLFDKNISFKINSDTKYAVFGHSHAETAFNDSLISNFQNFSRSGDAYFYIYPKIKKIIAQNKNLNTVIIELTNNQVSKMMDEWTWGDIYLSTKFKNYEPFIDLEDQKVLLSHNFSKYYDVFFTIRKTNFWKMINNNYSLSTYNQFGGYNYLVNDKADSLLNNLTNKKSEFGYSKTNIDYLEKIITMLENENIKVILLRVPIHPKSIENNNELLFNQIITEKFSTVEYLDFNSFYLETNQFGDLEHLNYRGAKVFSLWFDSLIKKGLFDKKNKQDFIDKSITSYNNNNEIIRNLEENKKIGLNNKDHQISKILSNGVVTKGDYFFNNNLTSNKIIAYTDGEISYILIELTTAINDSLFIDKKFGIHLNIYVKDKDMRPQWLKDKNSYKLAYLSEINPVELNSKEYLLVSFKKKTRIKQFESIVLFLQDKNTYKGVIGRSLMIKDFKL